MSIDGAPLVPELIHAPGCPRTRPTFGRINFDLHRREFACPDCGRAVPIPWDYEERQRWATAKERERAGRELAEVRKEQQRAELEARRLDADRWMQEEER